MIEMRRFKGILLLVIIAFMFIIFFTNRILSEIIPEQPIDIWGWGMIGAIISGIFYGIDYKSTNYDWIYFVLFIFFMGLFLADFDDFYTLVMEAFTTRAIP
jgi:hypothetical protein